MTKPKTLTLKPTKTKAMRQLDPLKSYQVKDVVNAVSSLEERAGTLTKLAALTGISYTTFYNIKKKGYTTETSANRVMSVAAFYNTVIERQEPKAKDLKQDLDDLSIAHKYCNKAQSSKERGLKFELDLDEYKELLLQPRCHYTNVPLTRTKGQQDPVGTDVTLDRIDSHVGYIHGNVVACCHAANQFKSFIENPINELSLKGALMVLNKTSEHLGGDK